MLFINRGRFTSSFPHLPHRAKLNVTVHSALHSEFPTRHSPIRMAANQQFVGNYRMYHLIRAGDLYEIWAVRPMSETTAFALKWLPPGPKYSRSAIAELKHEYQVGVALEHPAVIKTYDFGNTSNGAYMLLELFKTPNLKQQIISGGNKKLYHRAKEILTGCAAGIAHLHEKGWIHRDIKPDNFLLRDDNAVKLIDFNLARKPAGGLSKLFGGGKMGVAGTHSYMSPEQIRGQAQDVRADIYSFGCMVHEFFSGKAPFTANSPNELLQRHLSTKPQPLVVFDKNITPEFANYVLRMMAKDPKDRPASMKDVMMEIKTQKIFYNQPKPLSEADAAKAATEKD
jgi:serine/threonine protein kinase